jgi:hypothetical protein
MKAIGSGRFFSAPAPFLEKKWGHIRASHEQRNAQKGVTNEMHSGEEIRRGVVMQESTHCALSALTRFHARADLQSMFHFDRIAHS